MSFSRRDVDSNGWAFIEEASDTAFSQGLLEEDLDPELAKDLEEIDGVWANGDAVASETSIESLQYSIGKVEHSETEVLQHMDDLDKIWGSRKKAHTDELDKLREVKERLRKQLAVLQAPAVPRPGPRYLSFVESDWYAYLCTSVVILNLTIMAYDNRLPHLLASFLDNIILLWYVIELCLNFVYFGSSFFIGKPYLSSAHFFAWLDAAIAISGVVDQWLVPLVRQVAHAGKDYNSSLIGSAVASLRFLRLFRLLRLLKVLKSFFFSDLRWLVDSTAFEILMSIVIALNGVIMGIELDTPWEGWAAIENAFLVLYVIELLLKLKRWSWTFFVHPDNWTWNYLDLFIVLSGVFDVWLMPLISLFEEEVMGQDNASDAGKPSMIKMLRLMRLLRVLRLARVLRSAPPLYKLLRGMGEALKAMQWVVVLTVLMLYAAAIVFTYLVGRGFIYAPGETPPHQAEEAFGSVQRSLFSLFKLMNGDTDVVKPICSTIGGQLLFVGFMILANWAILAILTSVVSENMMSASARIVEEEKERASKESEKRGGRRLMSIFERIDTDKSGHVSEDEWADLLQNGPLLYEMKEASGLGKTDLQDLFLCMVEEQTAFVHGDRGDVASRPEIDYRTFVRNLEDEQTVADKRSVLHVMIRLRALEQRLAKRLDGLEESLSGKFAEPPSELPGNSFKRLAVRKMSTTGGDLANIASASGALAAHKTWL